MTRFASRETISAMRQLLACVLLVACVPPAQEPAHVAPIPMPPRTETVATEQAIDGITVISRPSSVVGWGFAIVNDTDAPVSVIWDESTFVAESGDSMGRLIPSDTRRMDVAREHPPMPVPAHSRAGAIALIENAVAAEEMEGDYAETARKYGGVSARMNELIEQNRAMRKKAISGGRIDLVIRIGDAKQTWTGRVSK